MGVIHEKKRRIVEVKQQLIIDEAIQLIEQIGIDNLTMDNIAKAADYTKRTLYAYFKSKDEILLWVYTDDLTERWQYQKNELAPLITGVEKLKAWARSLFDFCLMNNHTLQIQKYMDYHFVDMSKINPAIFKRFEAINDQLAEGLREIFELGINDGSFRSDVEMDITISQFLYSYRAILNRAFSETYSFAQFEKQKYIEHYLNLFISGL